MEPAVSLQEAYKTIKVLMKEEKWLEAHRACLEVLRFDPENIKIIHLKNSIEKTVKKINIKAIKTDISKLKPLWNENKYEELLMNLKHLEPYLKDYPGLRPIIQKAEKKYIEQLRSQQEVSFESETKKIKQLLMENKHQEAMLAAERLKVMGIHGKELKKTITDIRFKWINNEINANKTLLSSQKFEDILLFYQKMLKIDPESKKIKNSIEKTKKIYMEFKIEEKKEYIYKSHEAIRTLYQLKKYEKVLEACEEILDIDPRNKIALAFKKKAAGKVEKIIDKEVITQMISNQKKLKEEYKKERKSFERI